MSVFNGTYNLTDLTSQTNLYGLVQYANDSTGSFFVGLFVVAIFFVFMFRFKRDDFDETIFISSTICFFLGVAFRVIDLINILFVLGFLILAALSGLHIYMNKR